MNQEFKNVMGGGSLTYSAPQCRVFGLSLQHPIMGLSNPVPGMAGFYNSDDDIIGDTF